MSLAEQCWVLQVKHVLHILHTLRTSTLLRGAGGKIWMDGGMGGWVSGRADGRTDRRNYRHY